MQDALIDENAAGSRNTRNSRKLTEFDNIRRFATEIRTDLL